MDRQIWGWGASDIGHKKCDLRAAKLLSANGVDKCMTPEWFVTSIWSGVKHPKP